MASASTEAASQTTSHSPRVPVLCASAVAATAVTPIATPPQPGTAVKAVARSMVERMKDRLSIARACNAGAAAGSLGVGLGMVMDSV